MNGQDFEFETDVDTAARLTRAGGFKVTGKNLWHITSLRVDYRPLQGIAAHLVENGQYGSLSEYVETGDLVRVDGHAFPTS
jgi:hypothetical protein